MISSRESILSSATEPGEPLTALPTLLEAARRLLVSSTAHGDPEAKVLLAALEESVVAAHRFVLRRRIESRRGGE